MASLARGGGGIYTTMTELSFHTEESRSKSPRIFGASGTSPTGGLGGGRSHHPGKRRRRREPGTPGPDPHKRILEKSGDVLTPRALI